MDKVTHKKVLIPVNEKETVSGVVAVPTDFQKGKTVGIILAHGAGNDMENPLIVFLSNGLAEAGFLTLRFNFLVYSNILHTTINWFKAKI
jgi:hypothetical protein